MPHELKALGEVIRRKGSPTCSSCGETAWVEPDNTVLLQNVDPDKPTTHGVGIPAFPLVCGNCGYVRLHSVRLLEKKLDSEGHNGSR
jgi:hypothetical protein